MSKKKTKLSCPKGSLSEYLPACEEKEIEMLQRELADLATSWSMIRQTRLIRIYDRYRMLRFRMQEAWLRLRAFLRQGLPIQQDFSVKEMQPCSQSFDVMIFSGANWNWRFQRPQQLATQWAKHGYRVFFISLDFKPQVNPAYLYPARAYTSRMVRPGLLEIHLAGPRELQPLGKRMSKLDIGQLMASSTALKQDYDIEACVSILEFPFWNPLGVKLRDEFGWKLVYDFMDRFHGVFPKAYSAPSSPAASDRPWAIGPALPSD